jgi:predicted ATPase
VKDFDEPVWIYQLGAESFPPVRTLSNTNLPRPASSFVGREREVAEVATLLHSSRLVTLTGPGGSGKTRLAIEAASELVGETLNGVFWVGLATVRDPDLVEPTIAQTVGATGELANHIGEKQMLLLLDNLEHVIEAARTLVGLVESCPNLTLLVTSRELLRVRGEVEYQVLPLAEPDAVALFCERAQLPTSQAVHELCRRLDDMPLALELAAARTKALTLEQILDRLGQRLDLFRGGRDAEPRQATLRATIEWSFALLDEIEQQLFARLGVFDGGCSLEAVDQICDADLDTVQSLIEKSLVRRTDKRFWMLETIREYALDRLSETDAYAIRQRHAEYFAHLVESAEQGSDSGVSRDHVVSDLANVRAAIDFARVSRDNVLELSLLGLASALMRDSVSQYRARLEHLVLRTTEAPARTRVRAIGNLSFATYRCGDFEAALRFAEQEYAEALELDDARLIAMALNNAAGAKLALGEPAGARAALEQAGTLLEEAEDERALAANKVNLADVLLIDGEYAEARRLCDEATSSFVRIRDPDSSLIAKTNAATASVLDRTPDAANRVADILSDDTSPADPYTVSVALQLAAAIAADAKDLEQAAVFLAAADALRADVGAGLEPTEERIRESIVARIKELPVLEPTKAAATALGAASYLRAEPQHR